MSIFLLIILISFIEYFGDSNFKIYARTNNLKNLYAGLVFYSIMVYFLIMALKSANVTYINGLWDGTSALIETILALVFLHETLSNNTQYMGLVFIIIGLFFLHYGSVPY